MSHLFEICKQNHGQDHELTEQLEKFLDCVKSRPVTILSLLGEGEFPITFRECESGASFYEFVRYDEDYHDRCLVHGPMSLRSFDWISSITSGLFDGFNTYSIDEVVFALGTPVTCRNMENSALEGAVGDIRGWDRETNTYTIYFDDDSLEPCVVKPRNIEVSEALEK